MENLLIIKTIYKIHPSVYILAFFSIITASFIEFITIMSLVLIHELGHYMAAILLKEEVKKIWIYPFGGITKINMELNASFKKEFIILSMGPIFQIIGSIILIGILPQKKELIMIYHNGILCFNMLPIYPLDGGKLLKLGLDFLCPYKMSFKIIIKVSYSIVVVIMFIEQTIHINTIYIIIFLVYLIRKEQKKEKMYYEKLLLEKYLKKRKYPRRVIIQSEKDFYKRRNHLIKTRNQYLSENEYLWKKYRNFMKSY